MFRKKNKKSVILVRLYILIMIKKAILLVIVSYQKTSIGLSNLYIND